MAVRPAGARSRGHTVPTNSHIALLRGINVGGKNRVTMAALVRLFEAAGGTDVRTYIQSGNVLFTSPPDRAVAVAEAVERGLEADLGVPSPVIVRSARALRRVIDACPFGDAEPTHLHVMFLRDAPTKQAIAALDPDRSPPDEFIVRGSEIYLRLPKGAARSKLTNSYVDRTLGTVSTARNWRTVRTLAEMAEGA
ncbi:MAG: DUF1697 domain-containing protein [Phycisphaerales bacterium]